MDQGKNNVNGHYVVPLPLKSKDVNLLNNRGIALKRLMCLQKRFLKDEHLYEMYNTLIADMIAKGYTRREDKNGKSAKTLYISHHGVVNPAKPGKFRVVFDSSEKYRGTSLNNQLISGPELTSKLFGVLKRFRAKQVAFIADFEAVFYQVRLLEVQRSFLRF